MRVLLIIYIVFAVVNITLVAGFFIYLGYRFLRGPKEDVIIIITHKKVCKNNIDTKGGD